MNTPIYIDDPLTFLYHLYCKFNLQQLHTLICKDFNGKAFHSPQTRLINQNDPRALPAIIMTPLFRIDVKDYYQTKNASTHGISGKTAPDGKNPTQFKAEVSLAKINHPFELLKTGIPSAQNGNVSTHDVTSPARYTKHGDVLRPHPVTTGNQNGNAPTLGITYPDPVPAPPHQPESVRFFNHPIYAQVIKEALACAVAHYVEISVLYPDSVIQMLQTGNNASHVVPSQNQDSTLTEESQNCLI